MWKRAMEQKQKGRLKGWGCCGVRGGVVGLWGWGGGGESGLGRGRGRVFVGGGMVGVQRCENYNDLRFRTSKTLLNIKGGPWREGEFLRHHRLDRDAATLLHPGRSFCFHG